MYFQRVEISRLFDLLNEHNIASLDLSHNNFGDDAIIAQELKNKDCKITSLDLSNNNFGEKGFEIMLKVLES
ncbi:MAG: hypothetical protein ACK56I_18190, partial [bacterium]